MNGSDPGLGSSGSAVWSRALAALTSIPGLAILLAASIFAFRAIASRSGVIDQEAVAASIVARDRPLGTHISLPASLRSRRSPMIIICATLCDCNADQLALIMRGNPQRAIPVVVVLPAAEAALERADKLAPFRRLFFFDPGLTLIGELNAGFMPRAYGISASGALVWKSDHFERSWPALVHGAEAALSNGSRL